MRLLRLALVLLLPLGLLTSCGDDDDDAEAKDVGPTHHVFTADDDQGDVEVAVGDTFDVVLDACIGCPYRWEDRGTPNGGTPYDGIITPKGDDLEREGESEDADGNPIAGGSGKHAFHYEATAEGGVNVELAYVHAGQTEPDSDDDVVIISVTVVPAD